MSDSSPVKPWVDAWGTEQQLIILVASYAYSASFLVGFAIVLGLMLSRTVGILAGLLMTLSLLLALYLGYRFGYTMYRTQFGGSDYWSYLGKRVWKDSRQDAVQVLSGLTCTEFQNLYRAAGKWKNKIAAAAFRKTMKSICPSISD